MEIVDFERGEQAPTVNELRRGSLLGWEAN